MTASDTGTTLIKIGGTRKLPRPGDVFCMLLSDRRYLFGRVIIAEAYEPMPKANLVYIYGARADSPDPPLGALTRDALLIPPIWTNRLGWTKGYWKTIAHQPLRRRDRLEKHCFSSVLRHAYLDESGERTERSEPCGIWGLASYRSIEDDICKALGLPLAPVDEQGRGFEQPRKTMLVELRPATGTEMLRMVTMQVVSPAVSPSTGSTTVLETAELVDFAPSWVEAPLLSSVRAGRWTAFNPTQLVRLEQELSTLRRSTPGVRWLASVETFIDRAQEGVDRYLVFSNEHPHLDDAARCGSKTATHVPYAREWFWARLLRCSGGPPWPDSDGTLLDQTGADAKGILRLPRTLDDDFPFLGGVDPDEMATYFSSEQMPCVLEELAPLLDQNLRPHERLLLERLTAMAERCAAQPDTWLMFDS